MKIIKKFDSRTVEYDLKEIKKYNSFTLFQVYSKDVPLFKTSFTNEQLKDIEKNNYVFCDTVKKEIL